MRYSAQCVGKRRNSRALDEIVLELKNAPT
jgi:hypothetical protein